MDKLECQASHHLLLKFNSNVLGRTKFTLRTDLQFIRWTKKVQLLPLHASDLDTNWTISP